MLQIIDNSNNRQLVQPQKKKVIAAIRPKNEPEIIKKRNIELKLDINPNCYQFPFTEELLKSRVGIKDKAKAIIQDRLEKPLGQCNEVRELFSNVFKGNEWIFNNIEQRKLAFKVNFPFLAKRLPNEEKLFVTCRDMNVSESVNLMPKVIARRFRQLPKQNISLIDVKACISMYRNIKLQEFLDSLFFKLLYNSMVEALELRKKGY